MGGRGSSSGTSNIKGITKTQSNRINKIFSSMNNKNAIRFELEGNGIQFRMTKNDNGLFTIKNRNFVYGKNVSEKEGKQILASTQRRFNEMNKKFKSNKISKK